MPYTDDGRLSADEKKRREDLGAAFEAAVALAYEARGYAVEHVGLRGAGENGRRGDGGVDLLVSKDDVTAVVQCKCWRRKEVPIGEVQRLMGIVSRGRKGATRGVLVTTSRFTPAAIAEADARIELIDGNTLFARLGLDPSSFHRTRAAATPDSLMSVAAPVPMPATSHMAGSPRLPLSSPPRGPVVARPIAHRGLRWVMVIFGLALLAAVGHLLRGTTHQDSAADVSATKPAAVGSIAAPIEKVRKPRIAAERAAVRNRTGTASRERDVVATTAAPVSATATYRVVPAPAAVEATPVYKSADMSDEEFAAWKRRKAQREAYAGMVPAPEADPANVDDPRNREPMRPSTTDATSPETLRVILRTNRR